MKLEICCGNLASVLAAKQAGAHRVELCSALEADGLTPSAGMIAMAVTTGICVHVLIRPREGNFVYSEAEVGAMLLDIATARELGAKGVVIGALTPDNHIDIKTCERLVKAAEGLHITFHRAFDVVENPQEALEQIIALGCHHLLTSGQAPKAEDGIPLLQSLVQQAKGRISIMPGAGVSPENIAHILRETGATEIHGSFRTGAVSDVNLIQKALKSIE